MRTRFGVLLAAVALTVGPAVSASADTITFENVNLGTRVPFSTTAGSTTAAFSSPDGDVFYVSQTTVLDGHMLFDADPEFHTLDILFNHSIGSIYLRFALNTSELTQMLILEAWLGTSIVGSATAVADAIPLGRTFPEGAIAFNSGVMLFDKVRLTSTVQDFAIDDVEVPGAVPDPGSSLLLLGMSLVGLKAWKKRLG